MRYNVDHQNQQLKEIAPGVNKFSYSPKVISATVSRQLFYELMPEAAHKTSLVALLCLAE